MEGNFFADIRQELMRELDQEAEWSDVQILEKIDDLVLLRTRRSSLTVNEKEQLRKELFYSVRKLDILQELLEDDQVTEIMVNGYENIFLEKQGKRMRWDRKFVSKEKLEDVIQQIAGKCNRVINENFPIVDARLENGSRVNAVVYPVALEGPILTIRRFPDHPITMEWLLKQESITVEAAEFLERAVAAGYSILIGGGTSSGKTTFLNALSNYIPKDERIITIEDSAELQIQGIDNLVRLEAKPANMEGNKEITIRDLIRTALRMAPDRIVVGEIRGAEAIDLLQAWNTGHSGSLGTAHANSSKDMISRVETMVLMGMSLPLEAVRRQIASGIDLMVHLGRQKDKSRKVLEITEVLGYENGEVKLQTLFQWDKDIRGLRKINALYHKEKMENVVWDKEQET
ncbi:MAG: CpaF family protein [Bacillota bacterium]|nr:CpaF family protein [Bacillota bacterium]